MTSIFKILLLFLCICFSSNLLAQSERIDSLKNLLNLDLEDKVILSSTNELFEEFHFRGNNIEAKKYADKLSSEAKKSNELFHISQAKINIAILLSYSDSTDVDQGRKNVKIVLKEALQSNDSLIIGQCYNYLGEAHKHKNEKDTLGTYFFQAYGYLKHNFPKYAVKSLLGMSYSFYYNKPEKSFEFAKIAYEKANESNDPIAIFQSLSRLVRYQYEKNEFKEASRLITKGIKLAEKHNYQTKDLIILYIEAAFIVLETRNNFERYEEYLEKAYDLSIKVNHIPMKVAAATALANCKTEKGEFTASEDLLNYVLSLDIIHHKDQTHIVTRYSLGLLYKQQKHYEAAGQQLMSSLLLCKKNGLNDMYIQIQAELPEILDALNYKDISSFIDTSTLNIQNPYTKSVLFDTKMVLAAKENDFENAYKWSTKLNEVQVEMFEKKIEGDIQEKLLEWEVESQKNEIVHKERLVKSTTFRNKILLISIAITLIFLAFLIYLFSLKKKLILKIKEKNVVISSKNIELSNLNDGLDSKNKMLAKLNQIQEKEIVESIAFQSNRDQQIKMILDDVDSVLKTSTIKPIDIKIIRSKLTDSISNKNDWMIFKRKIENLYPNFFKNLSIKHPDLNQREQTHCAYILLGMTVAQVADSLFLANRTVESSRYRLKKKMKLDNSDSLTNYIGGMQFDDQLINL